MEQQRKGALGLVFLTVFIDVIGFSIIFPLFPAMLEHYLSLEGEGSAIASLVKTLASFVPADQGDWPVTVLFGSLLGSIYSLLQFAFAPFWGSLSDRIGRRPTLLFTLAGTAASYLIWIFAGSFTLLIVARLLGGMMAGNISTASAVVADTCSGPERAKGMGIMGAGIGLGFVMGPAIGGLSASWDLVGMWPAGSEYGLNPFSGPALIALILAVINLTWASVRFPETLPAERRGQGVQNRSRNPFRTLRKIDSPGVRGTNMAYFLYLTAFSAIEFTLTFLCVERLSFSVRDNAYMFVFVGLTIAFVQGGLVRRLAPKMGERKLAKIGVILTLPGFIAIGLTQSVGLLYVGLFAMAIGSAFAMPCLTALVSRYSPEEHQGLALGTFRSMGALSRAIGPVIGGTLYWQLGSGAPYFAAGAFLILPLLLVLKLPEVKPDS
ncbi:MAG: MFS family permease [Planctomycetota bacterium]|jgi:MFS family permease